MTTPPPRRPSSAAKAPAAKKAPAKAAKAAPTKATRTPAKAAAAVSKATAAATRAERARALAAEAAATVDAGDGERAAAVDEGSSLTDEAVVEEVEVVSVAAPLPARRVEPVPEPRRAPTLTEQIYTVTAPIGRLVRFATTVVCLFLLIGIILVLADANTKNDIVRWIVDRSRDLVDPLHDAFKAKTYKGLVFKNWGLSLVVYFAVGRLLSRLLGARPS